MRQFVLLLLAGFALASPSARAESSDPGDLFVNAYMAVQAGDKAEAGGKYREALTKYRYAAQVLEQISDRAPSWQPSIIDYRKHRTAEAIARMQDKIAHVGGGKADPADTARTGSDAVFPPVGGDANKLFQPPDDNILPNTPPPSSTSKGRSVERRGPAPAPDLPTNHPMQELEDRMAKLQKDLEKAKSDAKKTQSEKEALARELDEAKKARADGDKKREALQQRADNAEKVLEKARADGKADTEASKQTQTELARVKKQLHDLKVDADAEAEYRQQLADRVRSAQAKIARLSAENATAMQTTAEVPGQIAALQKQIDATRAEKNDLVIKLARTENDLKSVQAQRDDALNQVAQMKEKQKEVEKLIAANSDLMAKLGAAEHSLAMSKEDAKGKDQELAGLRKETVSLRAQLDKAQKEGADYQRQMADLQQKLTEASGQIVTMKADTAKSVAERGKLQEENQVLRGIIHREQLEEARRSQTKKLVLGELAKMESKSKVLLDQIELLSSPVVKLTEKERKLFKKPELQISDTEITLWAPRAEPGATATEPSPQSEPQPPVAVTTGPANAPKTPPAPTTTPAPARVAATATPLPATPAPVLPPAPVTTPAPQIAARAATPAAKPVTTAATPKAASPIPGKAMAASKPPEPPPLPTHASDDKPGLSLEVGKSNFDLASNKHSPGPFSALPDDLRGKPGEKPAAQTAEAKPAAPPALPEKADKSGPPDAPLTAAGTGTANTSTAVMNLPRDLVPQAQEGKDLFEKGNYREAERVYEHILTKAPANLYILSNLGVVYFRQQKFPRAEEMFRKAIAIAPEDGFSHCTLGIVLYSVQKYEDAVAELTKALAINNKNATAHNYLGITASQKGWQDAAERELVTATTLDSNYADAFFNLSVVYATQQPPNKEKARKCYKRATELGAEPDTALEQLIK